VPIPVKLGQASYRMSSFELCLEYEAFTVDQKRLNNPKQGLRMVCETDDSGKTDLIERIAKMSQQLENLTHVQSQTVKITSILKIKHFKNKLSCLFDFSIFMNLVSLQIVAGERFSSPAFKSFPHFGIQLVYFNIVNCLVETGSTICILHPRKYNLLPPNMRPEIKKTNTKLCLADGGVICQ
jgi:hypothetical protein